VIKIDTAIAAKAQERYPFLRKVMRGTYKTDEALAAAYFEMVRTVFQGDGHHESFVFLIRQRKLVKVFPAPVENQRQKYLLMRSLAHEAVKYGADTAILVGEAWLARASDLVPYQRPSELETREEGLELTLVSKTGEPVQFFAMIRRDGAAVSLDKTIVIHGGAPFTFAPFYRAWGRPIPDQWLRMAESVGKPNDGGGDDQ
jgi:hypothetical protein